MKGRQGLEVVRNEVIALNQRQEEPWVGASPTPAIERRRGLSVSNEDASKRRFLTSLVFKDSEKPFNTSKPIQQLKFQVPYFKTCVGRY